MDVLGFDDYETGAELESLEHAPVTRVQLVRYAGASGDFNPLHTVEEFAREVGYDGVIAHGMLSMGFLGHYVQALVGRRGRVGRLSVRFQKPVRPGDRLMSRGEVEGVDPADRSVALDVRADRQGDGETVTAGSARLVYYPEDAV